MNLSDFDIIISEFGPIIGIYTVYSFIVSTIIQLVQFNKQLSELSFNDIIQANLVLFLTSTLVFLVIAICTWYEIKIFNSFILFLWILVFIAFLVSLAISFFMQKRSGLMMTSPVSFAFNSAVFLTLPHVLISAFITLLSSNKYGL